MSQQATALHTTKRDPAEPVAVDTGNAVVGGESLVDERVIGAEQLDDTAIAPHDAFDEQLRLSCEGRSEILVERRERDRVRCHVRDVAQQEPLPNEVVDQRRRPSVGQHPTHLLLENRRVAELAPDREVEQLAVRDTAPQKKGQSRREREVAHVIAGARRHTHRVALDPEDELGVGQHPLQRKLNAGLETVGTPAILVETEQRLDVALGDRTPIGPVRQPGENLPRAGRVVGPTVRMTDEDAAATGRVTRAVDGIRPADLHGGHSRITVPPLVDRERKTGLSRLQHALRLGELPLERNPHHTLAGCGRERHLEVVVRLEHVDFPVGMPEQRRVPRKACRHRLRVGGRPTPNGEPLDERAVHADVELLRRTEAADVVGVGSLETQLERVLAVHREPMPDRDAATRPERQVFAEAVVLIERDPVGLDGCLGRRTPDRETTDLPRRRHVALQQRRRDRQDVGHVVEPVRVRIVRGKQGRDVDVDSEQIANRVLILRPVETMERLGAARLWSGGRGAIELGLEIRNERRRPGAVRPRPSRRRHGARPKLPDHLFPHMGAGVHARQVRRVEGEPGGLQPRVVAGDAIAIEEGAVRGG